MTTATDDIAGLHSEIADLEAEIDRLQGEADEAERYAAEDAAEIIEAAFQKHDGFLVDVARECHVEYRHDDLFAYCRAAPCGPIRQDIEERERLRRKRS